MAKYRMRIYRAGKPLPELWQTHDIFAEGDAQAKVDAHRQYAELCEELAITEDAPTIVKFYLCDEHDRFVCETPLQAPRR